MSTTANHSAVLTLPSDTQMLITREFNAPRHLVYKAWTTPELVKRWWAGQRGQVTSAEIDLRAGGQWRFVMIANGGFEVAFHGEYREIVPEQRVVCTEVYEQPGVPEPEQPVLCTYTFTGEGDRTHLHLLVDHPDQALRDLILETGMEAGMQESLHALDLVAQSLR
ncbi:MULTISPECIES: SRPBCC family protein [unclassified Crossiella]|uniref:SRPBCC family protein n=1 Tax=unclassified Crossiella TaxID=2620835 RepID=UPI002000399B|nr:MULTISPECIES: SRPBCC family protein [unclassified Crossiella]MCK2241569.1 SRPBCC family protein [Crossiella sp. S99.2]MCK2255559.1 SRPBCC family protein [Crossiella sp. S99.1]